MTALETTDALFFGTLPREAAEAAVAAALDGMDDGELFLEHRESERIVFEDGRIRTAAYDTRQGFGLRAVQDEATAYAHAGDLTPSALARAVETVAAVRQGRSGTAGDPPAAGPRRYADANPLGPDAFAARTELLAAIDAYARGRDSRVVQVSAAITGEWQAVQILRPGGHRAADLRPLVRLGVTITMAAGGRRETGSCGIGGRAGYAAFMAPETWQEAVEIALRQAITNLDSRPAPAGEMPVILGPGWPGILLHEAIGHGLEGDFNRKGTSAFAGLMGIRIAAPGVTVVDDGTVPDRRGSLTIDDEATPSGRTTLIEDGILVGFIHDRLNARLMNTRPTGNGRRESYAHAPMPRMTNTIMAGGTADPADIIRSVRRGLYAVDFGGGQVDITSGKFVFSASEAYLIEDGRIGPAVKGATLIGNGPDALRRVEAVGSDLALDRGIGTCGKAGQGVPVGVGQPTILLSGLTIGGTAT